MSNKLLALERLYVWSKGGSATNFHSHLYEFMGVCDADNLTRLNRAFPDEVVAYLLWKNCASEKEFFEKYIGNTLLEE